MCDEMQEYDLGNRASFDQKDRSTSLVGTLVPRVKFRQEITFIARFIEIYSYCQIYCEFIVLDPGHPKLSVTVPDGPTIFKI